MSPTPGLGCEGLGSFQFVFHQLLFHDHCLVCWGGNTAPNKARQKAEGEFFQANLSLKLKNWYLAPDYSYLYGNGIKQQTT